MILNKIGRRLLALAMIASATTMMSAATFNRVVVEKTNNISVTILISETLETKISDNDNLIFTDGSTTLVSIPLKDVVGWKFRTYNFEAGVDEIGITTPRAEVTGRRVTIEGLTAPTAVRVISTSGRTVMNVAASSSQCDLDLSELPSGIYVIAYGKETVKIAVR